MPKKLDANKLLIIFIVILLVLTSGSIYYFNYNFNKLQTDYNNKILVLNRDLIGNLNQLKLDLENEIFLMQSNLSLKLNLVENSLNNFRKENLQEITTLNDLIEQIEKQSNIQLEELKEDLSSIQVTSKDFSAIIDDVIQSVVSIGTNKGQGSGAIIESEGYIVTNFHVVEDASIIRVLTYDGNVHDAKLIGFNDLVDVAVLKIEGNFNRLRFGDSDDVKVGEKVIALGNPAGLSFTVTEGIVSAIHRPGPKNLNIYTQIDVPINPGNSGGPLVDSNSRIIGVNNFKIGGFEGLGFAIESNAVKEITDDIIQQFEESQQ